MTREQGIAMTFILFFILLCAIIGTITLGIDLYHMTHDVLLICQQAKAKGC
jgi:hypothetical protein